MGSIPLPALDLQPTQAVSPLQEYAKVQQLKTQAQQQQLQQQEIQQNQLQLQDQQKLRELAPNYIKKDESGKPVGFDSESYYRDALASGVSPKTVTALQLQQADATQKLAESKKNGFEYQNSVNNQLYGMLEDVRKSGNPAQKQQAYQQVLFKAKQIGADTSQFPPQYPGDDQIPHFEAALGVHAQVINDAKTLAETQKTTAQTEETKANTAKTEAETQFYKAQGLAPGVSPEMASYADFIRSGGKPQDYKASQAQKEGAATAPQKLALAKAEGAARFAIQQGTFGAQGDPMVDMVGQGRVDLATALQRVPPAAKNAFMTQLNSKYPGYDQATYGVEKKVQQEFTSGDAAKNLTAFNTAIAHAGQLQQAADALDNGDVRGLNKVGNALGYQFGSDKTTNFNVIKNALSGEISKVFKGGQATDAEIREVQQPFDVANSPAQLKGAIQNAIHLMNSKRDALKQQYEAGRAGKPNFGGDTGSVSTPPAGGEVSATGPNGHKIVVRGGKWVDAQSGRPIQ